MAEDRQFRLRVLMEPRHGACYDEILALALATEQAGFDAFFRSDHLLGVDPDDPAYRPTDCWTTLGGLARDTARVRLGSLVTAATFRQPGLLAAIVAGVDQMSGGRVELGIGTGWYGREHAAFGLGFPSLRERFDRLEEQLEIITGLWRAGAATGAAGAAGADSAGSARGASPPPPAGGAAARPAASDGAAARPAASDRVAARPAASDGAAAPPFSFAGRYYRVEENRTPPRVVQRPHPPVIVGGAGPRRTPAIAARFATEFNAAFGGDPRPRFEAFARACEAIGRDPGSARRSFVVPVACGSTPAEAERRAAVIGSPRIREAAVIGPPELLCEHLADLRRAGTDTVYLHIYDIHDLDHIALLGAEVLPAVTGSASAHR